MDLRQLQMALSKSDPENVYTLFGEEIFLVDECLKLLKQKTVDEDLADFNFNQYYATETKPSQVRDLVETLPMMSPRRVVFYKQAHVLKEKDWEVLYPILENPIESCVFVLVADKLDKRKKSYKKLQKQTLIELKKPYDNQVSSWVQYIGTLHDLQINSAEAGLIFQLVGNNLTEINNEVQKLKQFLGGKTQPTSKDILAVVSRARVDSVFDLTDAIGGGQKIKAFECLKNLIEHGQSEVGIVMLIARHIRLIKKVKALAEKRATAQQISQSVGVPPFFVKKYMAQTRVWNDKKLSHAFCVLHDTDKKLKSVNLSSHILLQDCILSL